MEPAICLFRAWAFLDMQSTIRQVNMSQVFHQPSLFSVLESPEIEGSLVTLQPSSNEM
jgi:hypothetical protein